MTVTEQPTKWHLRGNWAPVLDELTEMNLRVAGLSFFPGTGSAGMNSPFGFMVASSDALGTSLSMSPAIVRISCTGDAMSTTLSNCAPCENGCK